MKNLYLLMSIIVLLATCSGEKVLAGQREFTLTGKFLNNTDEGKNVYLQIQDSTSNSYISVATTKVVNGGFIFKGATKDNPEICCILSENMSNPASFVLEEGNITMLFDTAYTPTVGGTALNDTYQEYINKKTSVAKEGKRITNQIKRDKAEGKFSSEEEAKLNVQAESIYKEFLVYAFNVSKDNIKNIVGELVFAERGKSFNQIQLEEILPSIDPKLKNYPKFQKIEKRQQALQLTAVGNNFVDLTGKTPEGVDLSLSEFVNKGKYVVINFWASWCPSCREEIPHIVSLYNKYKDKGLEIVGISLDNENEAWKKGIENLKISWPQISDLRRWESDLGVAYAVNAIPQMVLLDANGKIISRDINTQELSDTLAELLK